MDKIRQQMLDNFPVKGCEYCYEVESTGGSSLRNASVRRYGIRTEHSLEYMEISLSNLCNMKCRSCNSSLSTKWASDDRKLGRPSHGYMQAKLNDIPYESIKYIRLIGGEPLLESESIIEILSKIRSVGNISNLTVDIATNLTILPSPEVHDLFSQCKSVFIQASLDSMGPLNDYIRHGSSWDEVSENLIKLIEMYGKNGAFVNTVVTVFNINRLDDLSDWIESNIPNLYQNHSVARSPARQAINNLPDDYKNDLRAFFQKRIEGGHSRSQGYRRIIAGLNRPRTAKVSEVIGMTETLDRIRNQRLSDVNPELWNLINSAQN